VSRFEHPPGSKRLIALPRRSRARIIAEMDEELRFFLEARVVTLMSQGLSRDEAEAEAIRRLGDTIHNTRRILHRSAQQRERQMTWAQCIDEVRHDLRYAVRGLWHAKGLTGAVMLTLGLGIGANAAMFGIVDRLLLRPPAFLRDPDNVHRVYLRQTVNGTESFNPTMSLRHLRELTTSTRSFDRTAGLHTTELPVGSGLGTAHLLVQGASAGLFDFFSARPALGRYFSAAEDSAASGAQVAVLGFPYWQAEFGGADDVIGKTIRVGSLLLEVIGVAAQGFSGTEARQPALIIPLTTMASTLFRGDPTGPFTTYGYIWLEMVVHRRPGVSLAAASTDVETAYRQSYAGQREARPSLPSIEEARPGVMLAHLQRDRGPNQSGSATVATWLLGVTTIVLLIACANVASLLLARAFARRREVALRLALGVSRGRLFRQLMTESLLLAVLGGAAGLVIAQWGGTVLRALFLPEAEWRGALADGRTLAFTAAAVLFTGILAGLLPALQGSSGSLMENLKAGVREGTSYRSRARAVLLVVQAALSVVLLVGAGLFVRSLQNVRAVDLGFDYDRLLYISIDPRGTPLNAAGGGAVLEERLREHASHLPSVERVSRILSVPFWSSRSNRLYVPGVDSVRQWWTYQAQGGSPEYFETVGTRILRGRGFERGDVEGAHPVLVVSEPMARAIWPGEDAIGKCIRLDADTNPCREIVGIAEPIQSQGLTGGAGLQYYIPIGQAGENRGGLLVRTHGDAGRSAETIRRELQTLMPGDAFVRAQPVTVFIDPVVRSWRLGATLFTVFGGLALVLAMLGLFSVVAYQVTQRSHELGVRMALGARAQEVRRLVLWHGMRLTLGGIVLGIAVAIVAGRFVEPLLFDVSPREPAVITGVVAVLLAAAVVACLVPARRAARIDPVCALRGD
jgi:predicted permease